jgi:hypothetical protein
LLCGLSLLHVLELIFNLAAVHLLKVLKLVLDGRAVATRTQDHPRPQQIHLPEVQQMPTLWPVAAARFSAALRPQSYRHRNLDGGDDPIISTPADKQQPLSKKCLGPTPQVFCIGQDFKRMAGITIKQSHRQ